MKKSILILLSLVLGAGMLNAQEYYLHTHRNGNVTFEKKISEIDSIWFQSNSAVFNYNSGLQTIPFTNIDSVTFSTDNIMPAYDIYIIYNGNSVTITNPLAGAGVTITDSAACVNVVTTAGITDIIYHVSGTTTDGCLNISSDKRFTLSLEGASITSTTGAAINSIIDKKMTVILADNSVNYLKDCANGTQKAALYSKGQVFFYGNGTLTVEGMTKHAISSGDYIEIYGGNIVVTSAVSDGLHGDYIRMHNGNVTVSGTSGDGLDGDTGFIEINGGTLNVTVATADTKAVKCDSILTINGGTLILNATGAQSKVLKSDQNITINGGNITITASGATVLETVDNQTDPSYCSAITTDGTVNINGGNITLTLPVSNNGGKGISADGNITITGGSMHITTSGAGAAYTVSGSTKDSYSSSCIKTDANLLITGGDITCSSSGAGGKGIRADSAMVIGAVDAADSLLTLNVTTSGARFTVTSGGGWGPGGNNGDYCNPKAIRAGGNLTINSGVITVNCTQSGEGGEGIESKAVLNINGGQLTITSTGDDAINAANRLNINGGTTYAASTNNDAIDCNGPMYVTGGFTIAAASRSPEESFDCDNNTFGITGGTIIGTAPSGMYSNPTSSACTQHVLKYTHAANNNIQLIRNSDNEVILTFKVPSLSGGGGPGGGGSSAIMTFSSPEFTVGTYTLKYGGTITGGTNFHNYYTGASYTGGSTKTVTVNTTPIIVTAN